MIEKKYFCRVCRKWFFVHEVVLRNDDSVCCFQCRSKPQPAPAPRYTARLVETEFGGWWGVFMQADDPDYPKGVLVCTVCNHPAFFDAETTARRIADGLNKKGITT